MAKRIDAIAGHIPVEKDALEEVAELQHNAKGNTESFHTKEVKEQGGFLADRSAADKIFYSRINIKKKFSIVKLCSISYLTSRRLLTRVWHAGLWHVIERSKYASDWSSVMHFPMSEEDVVRNVWGGGGSVASVGW